MVRIVERRRAALRPRNALHQLLPALQGVEDVAEHLGVLRIQIAHLGRAAGGRRTAAGRHCINWMLASVAQRFAILWKLRGALVVGLVGCDM